MAVNSTKTGQNGVNFGVYVEIRVFNVNSMFWYLNENLKCFKCIELSFGQIDHNSKNVSEFEKYPSFNAFNGVLRCSSILIR